MADEPKPKKIVIPRSQARYSGPTMLQGSGVEVNQWDSRAIKTRLFKDMDGILHPISSDADFNEKAIGRYGEHYVRDGLIDFGVKGLKAFVSAYSGGGSSVGSQLLVAGTKMTINTGLDVSAQAAKGQDINVGYAALNNVGISKFKSKIAFDPATQIGTFNKFGARLINLGNNVNYGTRALDNPLANPFDKEVRRLGTLKGGFYIGGAKFADVTVKDFSIGQQFESSVYKNLAGKPLYTDENGVQNEFYNETKDWTHRELQSYQNLLATVDENGNSYYTPAEAIRAINEFQKVNGKGGEMEDLGDNLARAVDDWAIINAGYKVQQDARANNTWANDAFSNAFSAEGYSDVLEGVETVAKLSAAPFVKLGAGLQYLEGAVLRAPELALKAVGGFVSTMVNIPITLAEWNNIFNADDTTLENSRIFITRDSKGVIQILGVQSSFTGPFGEESLDSKISRANFYGNAAGRKIVDLDLSKLTLADTGGVPVDQWIKEARQRLLDNEFKSIYIGREFPGLFQPKPKTPEWTNEQTQDVPEEVAVTTQATMLPEVTVTAKRKQKSQVVAKKNQTQYQKDKYGNTWTFKNGVAIGWKDGKTGQVWSYDAETRVIYRDIVTDGKPDRLYPSITMFNYANQAALSRMDLSKYKTNL